MFGTLFSVIEFKILKKSSKSRARLGILKTPHGEVETPSLVPVATQGVVKALTNEEIPQTKTQILICNTFHLHLKPGSEVVERSGGLHSFANLNIPLMTDSGGFQVFSLGFGRDLGVGKLLKYFPGRDTDTISENAHPKRVKITSDGVRFQSPIDGRELFIGPKESIAIQEKLGADIIFAFDECTPPTATLEYARHALDRTHSWAKICAQVKKSKQALFGIVQGSHFKELREEAARFIGSLNFDGYGIGGDLGRSKQEMLKIINWCIPHLLESKLRHLLGIGYLEDMENVIKSGIDTFDCTVPTHYARRGVAFTSTGRFHLNEKRFSNDQKPLDQRCKCLVCQDYKRNYISHLVRAKEITGLRLLTFHNLFYFNTYVENIRKKIKSGKI